MRQKFKSFEERINNIIKESKYAGTNSETDFIDEDIIITNNPKTKNWDHLYEWLKNIFGDNYLKAADSFMLMSEVILPNHKSKKLYIYKHYRTRASILIDEDGWPYNFLDIKNSDSKYPEHLKNYDTKTIGVRKISNKEAFNKIYQQLIEWIKDADAREQKGEAVCVDGICMKPSFFDDAKEIYPLLLKQLRDNGWTVISGKYDPKNIIDKNPDIFDPKDK